MPSPNAYMIDSRAKVGFVTICTGSMSHTSQLNYFPIFQYVRPCRTSGEIAASGHPLVKLPATGLNYRNEYVQLGRIGMKFHTTDFAVKFSTDGTGWSAPTGFQLFWKSGPTFGNPPLIDQIRLYKSNVELSDLKEIWYRSSQYDKQDFLSGFEGSGTFGENYEGHGTFFIDPFLDLPMVDTSGTPPTGAVPVTGVWADNEPYVLDENAPNNCFVWPLNGFNYTSGWDSNTQPLSDALVAFTGVITQKFTRPESTGNYIEEYWDPNNWSAILDTGHMDYGYWHYNVMIRPYRDIIEDEIPEEIGPSPLDPLEPGWTPGWPFPAPYIPDLPSTGNTEPDPSGRTGDPDLFPIILPSSGLVIMPSAEDPYYYIDSCNADTEVYASGNSLPDCTAFNPATTAGCDELYDDLLANNYWPVDGTHGNLYPTKYLIPRHRKPGDYPSNLLLQAVWWPCNKTWNGLTRISRRGMRDGTTAGKWARPRLHKFLWICVNTCF